MSDIVILKELIQCKATLKVNQGKVILGESASDKYQVTIHKMPDDNETIVIKADIFTAPTNIFINSKHECKRADFVIVADTNEKKVIICIELKAGRGGSEGGIIQQLKGAKCFVLYCQEIGKLFWNQQRFLADYEYRFVSIKNISISKKTTRSSSRAIHDHPDQMLKISGASYITFKDLVGK